MPTSGFGNEVSVAQRMLIILGLDYLRGFRNDYTNWTNFIANIAELCWTSFVQAGDMSLEVIASRFEEIIVSLLSRGVSARETLMDVFATICGIFEGALQSTTKLLRLSEVFEMMRGPVQLPSEEFIQDDTSEASVASSEASSEASEAASTETSSEASKAASEASKAASEASKAPSEAFCEEETKAEEEEKAKFVEAEEKAMSETEAKTEAEVDNTTDYPATDWVRIGNSKMVPRRDLRQIPWNIHIV